MDGQQVQERRCYGLNKEWANELYGGSCLDTAFDGSDNEIATPLRDELEQLQSSDNSLVMFNLNHVHRDGITYIDYVLLSNQEESK